MFKELRPAIIAFTLLTVITGIAYPLVVTGFAQLFPNKASGSVIEVNGKAVGSALIGQPFSDPKYFWGRPSATSPQPYNGAASSGSNQETIIRCRPIWLPHRAAASILISARMRLHSSLPEFPAFVICQKLHCAIWSLVTRKAALSVFLAKHVLMSFV